MWPINEREAGDLASWIHLRALCLQQKIAGSRPAGRRIHACKICTAIKGRKIPVVSLLATIKSPSSCWGGEATAAVFINSQPFKGREEKQEDPSGAETRKCQLVNPATNNSRSKQVFNMQSRRRGSELQELVDNGEELVTLPAT